jgi:hypothetical protein
LVKYAYPQVVGFEFVRIREKIEISLSMDLSLDVVSRVCATVFVAVIVVCLQGRVSD